MDRWTDRQANRWMDRQTGKQMDGQADRQTDRWTDKQTDRRMDRQQTDRQMDRQTGKQMDRQMNGWMDGQTNRQAAGQTNRQKSKQMEGQTGRQMDGQTGRQMDRQINIKTDDKQMDRQTGRQWTDTQTENKHMDGQTDGQTDRQTNSKLDQRTNTVTDYLHSMKCSTSIFQFVCRAQLVVNGYTTTSDKPFTDTDSSKSDGLYIGGFATPITLSGELLTNFAGSVSEVVANGDPINFATKELESVTSPTIALGECPDPVIVAPLCAAGPQVERGAVQFDGMKSSCQKFKHADEQIIRTE